jgi:hypothetical protein
LALYGALWVGISTVYADGLTSEPNPSEVGQTVTFTYSFTMPCDGAVVTFSIDGQSYGAGSSTTDGTHFTAVYAMAFSTAGNHTVVARYDASPASCAGTSATLVEVVNAAPPPPPPPPPEPSPTPPAAEPSPSESPSPVAVEASPTPASGVRAMNPNDPGSKFPAGAVAVLVLVSLVIGGGIYAAVRPGTLGES